jgi:hypothetical protein
MQAVHLITNCNAPAAVPEGLNANVDLARIDQFKPLTLIRSSFHFLGGDRDSAVAQAELAAGRGEGLPSKGLKIDFKAKIDYAVGAQGGIEYGYFLGVSHAREDMFQWQETQGNEMVQSAALRPFGSSRR